MNDNTKPSIDILQQAELLLETKVINYFGSDVRFADCAVEVQLVLQEIRRLREELDFNKNLINTTLKKKEELKESLSEQIKVTPDGLIIQDLPVVGSFVSAAEHNYKYSEWQAKLKQSNNYKYITLTEFDGPKRKIVVFIDKIVSLVDSGSDYTVVSVTGDIENYFKVSETTYQILNLITAS